MVFLWLGCLGVITSVCAVVVPIYFARKSSDYSAVSNTLSELGALGSLHQHAVSFCYFLPLSIAIAIFIGGSYVFVILDSLYAWSWLLLGLVSFGYLVAAFFPCDIGSPTIGSRRNAIHNIAGLFEYLGAGIGLILLGAFSVMPIGFWEWDVYLIITGSVILLMLVLLMLPPFKPIRGALQRVAEVSFFGWMLVFSILLLINQG